MTFPIRHRRLRFRPVFRAVAVFLAAAVMVACGAGEDGGSGDSAGAGASAGGGRDDGAPVLTVGAASSLTDALEAIAVRFEASGAGRVELAFDSSAVIAGQIGAGAPIDVFVSADASLVEDLAASGDAAGDPVTFAGNRVVLVTPAGNPAGVTGLADLVDVDLVALCDPTAPCGAAAVEALERAGVDPAGLTVTDGRNARETLRSVADGGVDAGIVFATDALVASDRVEMLPIPGAGERLVEYRAVRVTDDAGRSDAAEAFVAFLAGPEARRILADHGFDPAPEMDAAADDVGRGEASPGVPAGAVARGARSGDARAGGVGRSETARGEASPAASVADVGQDARVAEVVRGARAAGVGRSEGARGEASPAASVADVGQDARAAEVGQGARSPDVSVADGARGGGRGPASGGAPGAWS